MSYTIDLSRSVALEFGGSTADADVDAARAVARSGRGNSSACRSSAATPYPETACSKWAAARSSTSSSKAGNSSPPAIATPTSPASAPTRAATCTSSAAATTRSWSTTATASSSKRGAKASSRTARTACTWARATAVPGRRLQSQRRQVHPRRQAAVPAAARPSGPPILAATTARTPGTVTRRRGPFNRPTNLAVAPNGDLFVSDGYGNTRIHRFDDAGPAVRIVGHLGPGPASSVCRTARGCIPTGASSCAIVKTIAFRSSVRQGEYLTEWLDVQRPQDIFIDKDDRVYVGELVWRAGMTLVPSRTDRGRGAGATEHLRHRRQRAAALGRR